MSRKHYITARDGARLGTLAGPFNSEAEADANIERVRRIAATVDPRAFHYTLEVDSFPENSDYLPEPVITEAALRVA